MNFEDYIWKNLSYSDLSETASEVNKVVKRSGKLKTMVCINPHSYVVAANDAAFQRSLMDADWLLADGIGIVLASKLLFGKSPPRVTGPDIFYEVMHNLNKLGASVFFLGSNEETLMKIKHRVHREFPDIRRVDFYSPPFSTFFTDEENTKMLHAINEVRPDVLWVGMTAPKQEKWIQENRVKLNVPFAAAIGAAFDFYAGTVQRAPQFVRKIGMEWTYRSIRSPARLGKRNLLSNPKFVGKVLNSKISKLSRR